MLYHLLVPLSADISVLNVTRYITFRTAAASLTALAISSARGPYSRVSVRSSARRYLGDERDGIREWHPIAGCVPEPDRRAAIRVE